LVSALGQQAIAAIWGDGWDWVNFGQAVLANAVIAIILAVVARALQKEQDRAEADRVAAEQNAAADEEARWRENAERGRLLGLAALPLAVSGWSNVPPEPGTVPVQQPVTRELLETLADDTQQWRDLAQELDTLVGSRPPSDANEEERQAAGAEAFFALKGLSNRLQLYLMEGGRRRRLIYLRWLTSDLAAAASAGWSWSPAVYRFRNAAVVLFGWVQHTDTTIVERLLVERVTHLFYPPPTANQWRETTDTARLADPAVGADPVYLLIFHINQACARIEEKQEYGEVGPLVDLVARSLGALRNEMRAAADCGDALLAVAREARETDAPAERASPV
jgi:hypothetical protein